MKFAKDDTAFSREWLDQHGLKLNEPPQVPPLTAYVTYDEMVYHCLHRLYLSALGAIPLRQQERDGILEVLEMVTGERNVQIALHPHQTVDPQPFREGET